MALKLSEEKLNELKDLVIEKQDGDPDMFAFLLTWEKEHLVAKLMDYDEMYKNASEIIDDAKRILDNFEK